MTESPRAVRGRCASRTASDFGRQHFLYFCPLPQGQGSLRPGSDMHFFRESRREVNSTRVAGLRQGVTAELYRLARRLDARLDLGADLYFSTTDRPIRLMKIGGPIDAPTSFICSRLLPTQRTNSLSAGKARECLNSFSSSNRCIVISKGAWQRLDAPRNRWC